MGSRFRLPALSLAVVFLLVVPASAATDARPASAADATGLAAKLTAPTHTPTAGNPWPIRITAHDRKGHRVRASVRYAYIYQGKVVSRINPKGDNDFVGVFRDTHLTWSKRTIGLELTFRAIVDSKVGQANLDYMVKVQR